MGPISATSTETAETVTRIKICGITNSEDALAAIEYGADALGFIWVPGTPRYVGGFPGGAEVPDGLPPFVSRVAVCTTPDTLPEEAIARFDTIQVYAPCPLPIPGKRSVRAFRIRDEQSLTEITAALEIQRPHALLLDTYHGDKLGGSGQTFDWSLALEAKRRFGLPIILAGGLTPDNVAQAVATVRPYAVDVASGVEAKPGRKDHAKLKAFIQAVRAVDRNA